MTTDPIAAARALIADTITRDIESTLDGYLADDLTEDDRMELRDLIRRDIPAALGQQLVEARLEGWRAGRDAAADELEIQALATDRPNVADVSRAIRALPEPKGDSHD